MNNVRVTCDGCDVSATAAVRNVGTTRVGVAMPAGWLAPGHPFTRGTVLCPACTRLDATRATEPTTHVRARCDRGRCRASEPMGVDDRFPDTLYLDLPPGWRMVVNATDDGYDVLCPVHAAVSQEIAT